VETSLSHDSSRRQAVFLSPALILGGLFVLVVVLFLLSLTLGSVAIPLEDILKILTGQAVTPDAWQNIVLKFRLPKTVTALLAGASLGVAGLLMQTFFRNPLADPAILGISSGASLGVALVVFSAGSGGGLLLAGLNASGDFLMVLAAATGAGIAMLLVLALARQVRNPITLLIVGLMFGYLTSAGVTLMMHFAVKERVQAYTNWTFGSFGGVTVSQLVWFVPFALVGLCGALVLAKSLNALLLGENYARSMGLNVRVARVAVVGVTAILTGAVTAFCGPIGFIGVAVPHIARNIMQTSDHRVLLPTTVLVGGLVAMVGALIAEVPNSQLVLPLNAVMALLGAPIVLWVILRGK
jgi:iron complex transport system permease protein